MNVPDLFELASKKKFNKYAEKAREKVSRESDKIIRRKVAKDAMYWNLEEGAHELQVDNVWLEQTIEASHLQRDVALAGCQDELRSYGETMHKLSGCLHVSDALEESALRLRRTLQRCRTDQQELGASYEACGERLREAARSSRADEEREATVLEAAARQLMAAREQDERVVAERDAEHAEQRAALARALDAALAGLRMSEEALAAVHSDTERLLAEADTSCARQAGAAAAADAQVQAARADADKMLRQRDELRRAVVSQRADLAATVAHLKTEVTTLADDNKQIEKLLDEKEQCVAALAEELADVRARTARVTQAARRTQAELQAERHQAQAEADAQAEAQARAGEEVSRRGRDAECAAAQAHADAEARRAAEERRAAALERELDDAANHIGQLMGLLKAEADERARADAELADTRRQHERVRAQLAAARAQHEERARSQGAKLAAQRAAAAELQRRRAQLHERARAQLATIRNIQRQLAPRRADDVYGFLSDTSQSGDALHGPVSLSQVKKNMKKNVRNRRHQDEAKKHKG